MPERKKIAAIVTTWFPGSHADLIASKFVTGFPTALTAFRSRRSTSSRCTWTRCTLTTLGSTGRDNME